MSARSSTAPPPRASSSTRSRLRHLEVVTGSEGGVHGSLLHELDRTATAMGARLLRGWLLRPLLALEPIRDRLDAVEELAFRTLERGRLREALTAVLDLERLVARASLGTAGPRDLVALRDSCAAIPRVRAELDGFQAPLLRSLVAGLDDLADLRERIGATLLDEPPALARDGGFTRDGFDAALDEIRVISRSGRQLDRGDGGTPSARRTGIASLKVKFNRVFGYYIEISKSNLHLAPPDYQRKQTIAGGERFTTPALKDYEERVLGADERILARELEIFEALRQAVAAEAPRVQDTRPPPRHGRRAGRSRRDGHDLQLHQAARARRRRTRRHRGAAPGGRAPHERTRSCRTTSI